MSARRRRRNPGGEGAYWLSFLGAAALVIGVLYVAKANAAPALPSSPK